MAEIVNLRQARKARQRVAGEHAASVNRAKFGQTKGEKAKQQAEADRRDRLIDGAWREPNERPE